MLDLNDLHYFAEVVDAAGFAPAGRKLNVPKSRLSRRIAQLEKRLDVRLINRSTRQFSVTEIGREYYAHCKAMLVEAQAAEEAIGRSRAEPCGVIRLSCPVALLHAVVQDMLVDYLRQYPGVSLQLEATNRAVDVVGEGFDLALRVRNAPLEDSELMVRMFSERQLLLVASPDWLQRQGTIKTPEDLVGVASLDFGPPRDEYAWQLHGTEQSSTSIQHQPRLVTDDMVALRSAALAGLGPVQMPSLMVIDNLRSGALVRLLPEWALQPQVVHAVYPSRRGQLPSVRALLDFLVERFAALEQD